MAENLTTGELYKAKAILEADVVAAVDAFMADPTTTLFVFGDGYRLDLAAAVRSHPWADTTVRNAEATVPRRLFAPSPSIHTAFGSRPIHPPCRP